MSKSLTTKNVAAVVLGLGLVLALSFSFATPAKAQLTIGDLQSQINALLAQIAALQGGTFGGACFTFTQNLTIGSTGNEVMQAQKFLNAHGALVSSVGAGSPGNETAYFGARTRGAVSAYQAMNGITPTAGYWGPITRASANSKCVVVAPPPGPPGPPGAPGAPGPIVLQGTAGSISVTQTSTDVEDETLSGQTEKVLGLRVEASGSDLLASFIRIKFTKTNSSSAGSDRLSNYADEIIIYADGEKVGSLDTRDFVRDSAGVYSGSIPISQVIRMGSSNRVVFHVGFAANPSIDSDDVGAAGDDDWTALFVSLRYTDATGAVLTDTTTGVTNTGIYVKRVSASSDVKLRMAEGSNNPTASNVKVSTSGTTDVTLAEFTLKAEGSDMTFDQLRASTTITGTTNVSDIASDFYLMRGSNKLAEKAASTGTSQAITFSLDNLEELSSGDTKTYKIVAKVKSIASTNTTTTFGGGDTITASTSVSVWNINAKAVSDGKSVTERAGSVTTYIQTLYNEGIQVAKVSEAFSHSPNDTSANSVGEYKFTVRVTNFGSNDVYIPLNTLATTSASGGSTKGVAFSITDGTTATTTSTGVAIPSTLARVSGGTEKTNSVLISGGQSADFVLTATFNPDAGYGTTAKQFRVQVWSVGHATTDTATAATIVDTTPVEDFRTSYYTINN